MNFGDEICRRISAATYGTGRPLAGSTGGRRVAQRADQRTTAHQRAHKKFTQVRAAARRKTLLLLWWIDGGMSVVVRSTLSRQGLPRGHSDYACMVAWVHQLSNPFYGCNGPPFIDKGVTTMAK